MDKPVLIFVEPQPRTLGKLRLALMKSRPDWQVLAVADATAALEYLNQRKVSLVMANFGNDVKACEEFFCQVRDWSPQIVRVGLLPESLTGAAASSSRYAHDYICETSAIEPIERVLERGLAIWAGSEKNPRLGQLLSNLEILPTPPMLYFDIRDSLESPQGSLQGIADLIGRDPAITARILKAANSGFYGSPGTVADLTKAINLLGMDLVLALVLSLHLYDQLPLPGVNLDALWNHNMAVSLVARELVLQHGGDRATATIASIAGLLHDMGQLVFLANSAQNYYPIIRQAASDESLLLQMEEAEFGVGHAELSAHILSLWGLPDEVVEAVRDHHLPSSLNSANVLLPTRAVAVAEWLLQTHQLGTAEGDSDIAQLQLPATVAMLTVGRQVLRQLVELGAIPNPGNSFEALPA
ncbi:MAG: HDOD domain-containing protein [Gammaproteobacteria bacterium]|nr:HDOD domain-containing protein [Gammaproteobacteria bacterium]